MDLHNKDVIQDVDNALFIEHHVQRIITQQEKNGVQFNKTRAHFYIHVLKEYQERLYHTIRPFLKLEVGDPYNRPISKPFLKDGSYASSVTRWYDGEEIPDIGGQFTRVQFTEPSLGKRGKLTTQLLRLGWKPIDYTPTGIARITVEGEPCPSLLSISNNIGQWISDWYTYRHREGQIAGLLKLVREDGHISAQAFAIGTPTFRLRHKGVVNIPRSTSKFGRQMRSLFCTSDIRKRKMVGFDASGLELRMLANFINDTDYTKEVVHGDVHTRNQNDANLPDRDTAKTFIYAFIYGAGDAKIGSIAGVSRAGGKRVKESFLRRNPKLAELIKGTERAASRGYLVGLDGRRLFLRKDKFTGELQTHKALNLLLQGAGAVVMKWAMVLLDGWVRQYNLDALKVIDMHDEGQYDVANKDVHQFGMLAVNAIRTAGVLLQLNVPLDAEYKWGTNWSHTH